MSAPMKKPRISRKKVSVRDSVGRLYLIPKSVAEKYRAPSDSIPADVFFDEYDKKHGTTKAGMLLRGIRLREGYTQEEFADLIGVIQTNLSKMELGKRAIGKDMAKRIEKSFDIDYRKLL